LEDARGSSRPLERELGSRPDDEEGPAERAPHDGDDRRNPTFALLRDRPAALGAIAAVALTVASLLWIGAELHYQSCLQKAEARTPGQDDLSRLVRQRDVENCSRLPF
jgi:hypothetical protein